MNGSLREQALCHHAPHVRIRVEARNVDHGRVVRRVGDDLAVGDGAVRVNLEPGAGGFVAPTRYYS